MAPQSSGRGARDVLDEIGGTIQEQAQNAAKKYSSELHGVLSQAKFEKYPEGPQTENDPCKLNHKYHTNVTSGHDREDPCFGTQGVRFSDTNEAECYSYEIKDKDSSIGFCAPYRRLNLCVKNLEHINPEKITNTHNLLADVLLAAKHEGQLLVKQYEEHKKKNPHSNICTILARSFADIGDIIRGKDLYLVDQQSKHHLEKRLESMFENIKKENPNLTNLKPEEIREYWWALNRDQVWNAITCEAEKYYTYSKRVPDGKTLLWNDKCGHKDKTMLTNLDYVPQYLRWFDEWSEEFCRKRNITLKMAKEVCQNDTANLYCSHNGYDCTKLIRNKNSCSKDSKCTPCSNKCIPYDLWLRNRRDEFKMQKGKYENEIKTYESDNDISNSNTKKKYYKEFYEKFAQNDYKTVQGFLKLLNIGNYCKGGLEGEEDIDFSGVVDKIFHRSKYCQVCPPCVVDCEGGKCKEKRYHDGSCVNPQKYTPPRNLLPTNINVLFSGDNQEDITEKLSSFCSKDEKENNTEYQKWQCYYKSSDDNNCEMKGSSYKDQGDPNIIVSDKCFHLWVKSLLIDTIKWETKLKKCINNTNVTDCDNKCNKNCECFDNWINTKKKEWEEVKNVYKDQETILGMYYKNLNNLFDSYFFEVMHSVKEEKDRKWNQITAKLKEIIESSEESAGTGNSQDKIKLILEHLEETAKTCKDNNSNESCDSSKNPTTNPCLNNTTSSNLTKTVKHIAELMQQDARKQLEKNVGEIKLKGDARKGKYTKNGKASEFKEICQITLQHSNRNPDRSIGPCGGKGEGKHKRFVIETEWQEDKDNMREGHKDVLIPPRRRHICTSNLEYLQTRDVPFSGNNATLINDSFLGDVLLSAMHEAKNIIHTYQEKNNLKVPKELTDPKHQETMCRAIRYSFADIGDIIRGRDIWDKETGMDHLKEHLKDVFEKIKQYHPGIKVNDKYKGDDKKSPPYKKLREDWWEANRHQVWRAMKCAIKEGNINNCNGIPIEDYIPQRLRWMTELAEWYVKFQSQAYKDFSNDCQGCEGCIDKGNGLSCKEGTTQGNTFETASKQYNKKIDLWKKQWRKLQREYSILYTQARVNAFKDDRDPNKISVQDKDKPVYDFLLDLYLQNGGKVHPSSSAVIKGFKPASTSINTPYDNAGAYVHDLVDFKDCKEEKVFCNSARTIIPPFPRPPAPAPEEETEDDRKTKEEVCGMVEDLIKDNDGTQPIKNCKKKDYEQWDCQKHIDKSHAGACMSPRRQKLCIYFLVGRDVINNITTKEHLRDAFIKSAAAETFFAWHYYKKKNDNAETQLNKGTIPPEFLRSMFYSYGDYRDLLFGTDISNDKKIKDLSKKIETILELKNKKSEDKQILMKNWWKENGPKIWEAMLCALEKFGADKKTLIKNYPYPNVTFTSGDKTTTLETFAQRPQFLRWFTEWGEEFCKKRKEQVEKLVKGCEKYDCDVTDEDEKTKCSKACEKYKEFIELWKPQYESQRKKFKNDKENNQYSKYPSTVNDIEKATDAHEYLHIQLKKLCGTENCDCMKEVSKQQLQSQSKPQKKKQEQPYSFDGNDMPASLDEVPEGYENKCNCKPPENKETDSSVNCIDTSAFELKKEAQKSIKDVKKTLNGKNSQNVYEKINNDSNRNDGTICKIKENVLEQNNICKDNENPFDKNKEWECKNEKIKDAKQDICFPPRRKHMCTNPLENIGITNSGSDDLLKHVLLTAAYEGKHIKESWDKVNEPKKKTQICDAMKYSFADLGDIIRGRDIYKNDDKKIEDKLQQVFKNIYDSNKHKLSNYNDNGDNKYTKLREAWWDANRKEVWKAMTCTAPKYANILKRIENDPHSFMVDYYCGHDSDPPVDDYIPQPFRWMKEWSENYCNAQNNKLSLFQDCEYCKINKEKCKQTKHGSCKKCTEKCSEYDEFVKKWEKQYEILKKSYENVYNKVIKNSSKASDETDRNDTHIKNFVNELKKNCKIDQPKFIDSVDKYLDKGNYCKTVRFQKDVSNNKIYAFDNPPKIYKESCRCAKIFEEVDQCPVDTSVCSTYGKKPCIEKYFNKRLYDRTNRSVTDGSNTNKDVIVPPRRKELCLSSISIYSSEIDTETKFKEYILHDASNEAKYLSQIYKKHADKALTAMKYSFADIGNVVKGDDMYNDGVSDKIKDIFEKVINKGMKSTLSDKHITPSTWWKENKEKIWNVMMCNYDGNDKTSTSCPSHGDIDEEDQFLRWFQEWGENFCIRRDELYKNMDSECKSAKCNTSNGSVGKPECTKACEKYKNYILSKEKEYGIQKNKYDTDFKKLQGNKKAYNFLIYNTHDKKCDCITNHIDDKENWKYVYDTYDNKNLKGICDCQKPIPPPPPIQPPPADEPFDPTILQTTIPFGVALALGSIAFFFMKKKTQAPVDLFSVINIPKGDYDIPTLKSSNRYIPYASDRHKGKTYIYMEGDSSGDEKYAFMSDTTDITSSESEYEELDINDIYVPGSPKYKTLIEVVLEPSKRDIQSDDIPSSDIPTNKFTDEEWKKLKHDFISNMLQNQANDVPNDYKSGNVTLNTQPNTLYFDKPEEKPFITSIHDRNLYSGEEYSYNVNMVNSMDDIPINRDNNVYSGIDLINDSLNNNNVDIYDELLKRKENELFGTNHPKHTTGTHNVTKSSNSDPIDNQLDLFHTWLDRHRDMCEQWNNKEEVLDKLKEEWNKDNNNGDVPSDSNKMLNTDVSIQIHMDNPKPINQFTNMDTILEDLDKYNEPYYDVQDDIYYDVNDHDASTVDTNAMDVPSKVQIEMDVNTKSVKEKYPIADVWDI
ncbi:erythrocyte membrane protein 1, PfEMP1, putative [Plasmodium sp.]|nr:erythrocyte membrane protein 1, PfEMP1, putative [Plasmodium sp.]